MNALLPAAPFFADNGSDVMRGFLPEISPLVWVAIGVCCFLLFWLTFCLAFASHDKARVRDNLRSQGARVLRLRRDYLLMDWFVEREFRSYNVRYRDRNGWEHGAICKTTNGGAIVFAEDLVLQERPGKSEPAPALGRESDLDDRVLALEAENRRLKEELQRKGKG